MPAAQINQYAREAFSAPDRSGRMITHDVYARGEGPPIVLIQELPGIGQETLRLADIFIDNSFSVILPHLFGPIGKVQTGRNMLRVLCLRREFSLLASGQSSPIVDWLRALCIHVKTQRDARGVGVIGMCLTGNFGLSLIGDDSVLAAVCAQPSLPFFSQQGLHLSDEELAASRSALEQKGAMQAYRFKGDRLCTAEKFASIREAFNSGGVERVRLRELDGAGSPHSVFTLDFEADDPGHPTQQALADVLSYFGATLA